MPIAEWNLPFKLTSAPYSATLLDINVPVTFASGTGIYLLRQDGCALRNTVRQTKDNVPQQDGAILHRRFLAGMEMDLAVQFWEGRDKPACDELLNDMLDEIMGYLYGLLNAGDNQGRISWAVTGSVSDRMLDDVRLFTYPVEAHPESGVMELTFTLDCALPYAEDLTQLEPTLVVSPGSVIMNGGNRPTYPVFKIQGTFAQFTLTNHTTGKTFNWDSTLPGSGGSVVAPVYLEVDMFRNTVYTKPGLQNRSGGIVPATSEFFFLAPGANLISLDFAGAGSTVLVNSAWA